MVARIVGFRTRAQLNMRRPRSVSRNISPGGGGAAVHWGGPRQNIGTHAQCEQTWRAWQNYHMNTHGWADIAYTTGFCNHGYALAGRGLGVRTAANGTNAGNNAYYAFTWIGGQGNTPTQAAVDALEWLIHNARQNGAGRRVRPHRDFTGSSCPGDVFFRHARRLDNTNIGTTPPPPPKPVEATYPLFFESPNMQGPLVRAYQQDLAEWRRRVGGTILPISADGFYGRATRNESSRMSRTVLNFEHENPHITQARHNLLKQWLRDNPPAAPQPQRRYEMLIYAKRNAGPDAVSALAAAVAKGRGVVTTNLDEAKAAVQRGEVVVAAGGPATQDLFPNLAGRGAGTHKDGNKISVLGSNATDTAKRLLDVV
jgi:hypothetical protein